VGKRRLAVSVDLGGTRFRVALCDPAGQLVARAEYPTRPERGPIAVLDDLAAAVRHALAAVPGDAEVVGVVVAAPGPLDPWRGVIYAAPNLPGWEHLPLAAELSARCGLPVRVGNDANLAAVGEHRLGAGRGTADMIYVTVSTGIGGGIIVGGRLLLGAHGGAGEIGHTVLDPDGPPCSCGKRGCLEALGSGTAIARQANAAVAAGRPTVLAQYAPPLTAEQVDAAADDGDALAQGIIDAAARAVGLGLTNLLHLFDPEVIVVGGGVTRSGARWWAEVRGEIERRALPFYLRDNRVVPAALGDDAGLVGAALYLLDEVGTA